MKIISVNGYPLLFRINFLFLILVCKYDKISSFLAISLRDLLDKKSEYEIITFILLF
jgi:hypothetical protein